VPILSRRALAGGALTMAAVRAHAQAAPVRVGVLTDMTGLYADAIGPGSFLAAQMAAEDAGGSVLGRKIEVLSADNQNKADIGSAIARQWYDRDHVGMIVGLDNSSVALAVQQVARERDGITVAIAVGTNDFTGKFCTLNAMSWNYDSYALTHGVARSLVGRGLDTWFFITVDYAFGAALESDASEAVRAAGGKVLGSVRHPLGTGDFSAFVIAAKASGAKVVALANGGGDMTGALKQANEFGLQQSGQALVPMLCTNADIHSLGLQVAQGINLMTSFTWDRNAETRAWSQRFLDRHHTMPSMDHAATYSAVLHYIKAVAAAGTTDTAAVVTKMRAMPVNDFYVNNARVRADGRLMHDMYLVRVKSPAESKAPWDYEAILQTVPGNQAFRPLAETGCPLGKA
jgi:branched-chain amino acid transport system substrate-binding protein